MFQTPKKSDSAPSSSSSSSTSPPVKVAVSRYTFNLRAADAAKAMAGIEKLLAEIDTENQAAWAKIEKARTDIEALSLNSKADQAKVKAAEVLRTTDVTITFNNALNAMDIMKPQIKGAREDKALIDTTSDNAEAKPNDLTLAAYACDRVEQVYKNFVSIHDLGLNAWGICKEKTRQLQILIDEATPGQSKTVEFLQKAGAMQGDRATTNAGDSLDQRRLSAKHTP